MKARWPFIACAVIAVYLAAAYVFMWSPVVTEQKPGNKNACLNNLRQIDGAKQQWADENGKPNGAPIVVEELNRYFKNGRVPHCPDGGIYAYNPVGTAPTCSLATVPRTRVRVGLFYWRWSLNPHHELPHSLK